MQAAPLPLPIQRPWNALVEMWIWHKLRFLGRSRQRGRRCKPARYHLCHFVEISSAHFALVLCCGVAIWLSGELLLLKRGVCRHPVFAIAAGELEHTVVQRMKACQRDELEPVAHCAQLVLEAGDRRAVKLLVPVKGWRAVVGQEFLGKLGMDGIGKTPGLLEVWLRCFAPDQIGVGCVRATTGNRRIKSPAEFEEALSRSLAGYKWPVALIDITGEEARAVGVGPGDHDRRYIQHVGCQPRSGQIADSGGSGDQDFAAHMAAFLLGCQLILEMHARSPGLDHGPGQLEYVQRATKPGLAIGDNRGEPVDVAIAFTLLDLVGAL